MIGMPRPRRAPHNRDRTPKLVRRASNIGGDPRPRIGPRPGRGPQTQAGSRARRWKAERSPSCSVPGRGLWEGAGAKRRLGDADLPSVQDPGWEGTLSPGAPPRSLFLPQILRALLPPNPCQLHPPPRNQVSPLCG